MMQVIEQKRDIEWTTVIPLIILHLTVLIGLPLYFSFRTPSIGLIATTIILFFATGIGITGGYHRLYAHRAYKASPVFQGIILFFATLAMQSSVVFWVYMHRLHHQFTDKERDPHNIGKGFWYAHVGWLFRKQEPIDKALIPDILENNITAFQYRNFYWLSFSLNLAVFLFFGWLFDDYWGALIILWITRVLVLQHATWFINSLAHTWGSRIFSREQSAVNNALLAFFTFGEGYHNYHHVFPSDYRNGVRWYHYDPTKWLIWISQKVGLASDLKKIDKYTSLRAVIAEDKRVIFTAIRESTFQNKEKEETTLIMMTDTLQQLLADLKCRYTKMMTMESEKAPTQEMKKVKAEFKEIREKFNQAWELWLLFTHDIMKIPEISKLVGDHRYHHD